MVSEVSAIAVASTSLRPRGERREGARAARRRAGRRAAAGAPRPAAGAGARRRGGAGDLGLAGQEDERAALGLGERREHEVGDGVLEARPLPRAARPRPVEPAGLDRKGAALGGDERRVAHQRGDRRGVEGRRHDEEARGRAGARRGPRAPARGRGRPAARARGTRRRSRSRRRAGRASDWSIRVRMPSVTTSIAAARHRLAADAVADPAADRARRGPRPAARRRRARRRGGGSSMRMRPGAPPSSRWSGTRVVLPAPGGACSTARPASSSACAERGQDRLDRQRRTPAAVSPAARAPPCRSRCGSRCARSSADPSPFGVEDQSERELARARHAARLALDPGVGAAAGDLGAGGLGPAEHQPRAARAVEDVDAGVADVARRLVEEEPRARPRSGRACRPASPGRAPSSRGGSIETRTGAPRLQSISVRFGPLRRLRNRPGRLPGTTVPLPETDAGRAGRRSRS